MNKIKAMSNVKRLIKQQSQRYTHMTYLNENKGPIDLAKIDSLHVRFGIGEPLGEVQMSVRFSDNYFDLLAFPSPIMVDENFASATIRFINTLNHYMKMGNGRFYLDESTMDVAISVRIPYYYLKAFPLESVDDSISGSMAFYMDVGYPIYHVSRGNMTVKEACDYIRDIWGD